MVKLLQVTVEPKNVAKFSQHFLCQLRQLNVPLFLVIVVFPFYDIFAGCRYSLRDLFCHDVVSLIGKNKKCGVAEKMKLVLTRLNLDKFRNFSDQNFVALFQRCFKFHFVYISA